MVREQELHLPRPSIAWPHFSRPSLPTVDAICTPSSSALFTLQPVRPPHCIISVASPVRLLTATSAHYCFFTNHIFTNHQLHLCHPPTAFLSPTHIPFDTQHSFRHSSNANDAFHKHLTSKRQLLKVDFAAHCKSGCRPCSLVAGELHLSFNQ